MNRNRSIRLLAFLLLVGIKLLLSPPSTLADQSNWDNCYSLFGQILPIIPQSLPDDPSLRSLQALYGDKIEIEERNSGPWVYLYAEDAVRPIHKMKDLSIGTYNAAHLAHQSDEPVKIFPSWKQKKLPDSDSLLSSEEKLLQQGKILLAENNDIQILQEVRSLEAAKTLNETYAEGIYRPLLIRGNDRLGLNIAVLFKKDLPFDIEIQSNRQLRTEYLSQNTPIFARDLPVILIRKKGSKKTDAPLLILMPHHLKSKRDRYADQNSKKRRSLEVTRSLEIKEQLERRFPNVPIVLLGDFNGDLHTDPDLSPFWSRGKLQDSFDLAEKSTKKKHRVTHTLHHKDTGTQKSQLDGILVSQPGQSLGLIKKAKVVDYRDHYGRKKTVPGSIDERRKNPSDHFMISTRWDFKKLMDLNAP